ncbi:uncharacterized protein METZ01_LOCUS83482 [marine metagenome]|uniref:Uncharacterized protein n=1 Tax=marine metagenome TaxID=408172 RepID=A0A381USL4_9ZZZZ
MAEPLIQYAEPDSTTVEVNHEPLL